jgi:hypothetical protein
MDDRTHTELAACYYAETVAGGVSSKTRREMTNALVDIFGGKLAPALIVLNDMDAIIQDGRDIISGYTPLPRSQNIDELTLKVNDSVVIIQCIVGFDVIEVGSTSIAAYTGMGISCFYDQNSPPREGVYKRLVDSPLTDGFRYFATQRDGKVRHVDIDSVNRFFDRFRRLTSGKVKALTQVTVTNKDFLLCFTSTPSDEPMEVLYTVACRSSDLSYQIEMSEKYNFPEVAEEKRSHLRVVK